VIVEFGSFAGGDAHEKSDIDVLALPPPEVKDDGCQWTAAFGQWTDQADRIAGNPVPSRHRRVAETGPWRRGTAVNECRGGSHADWCLSLGCRASVMTAARPQTQTRPASAADARAYVENARRFLRDTEGLLLTT
jgi:Nucleotidyltransferase domain